MGKTSLLAAIGLLLALPCGCSHRTSAPPPERDEYLDYVRSEVLRQIPDLTEQERQLVRAEPPASIGLGKYPPHETTYTWNSPRGSFLSAQTDSTQPSGRFSRLRAWRW